GAGSQVVGVLEPADWPPEAARLPRVGDARALDLERIVALKPDLAIVWPYVAPAQLQRLREIGVPVYSSDPHTPEAIAGDLERLDAWSQWPKLPAVAKNNLFVVDANLLHRASPRFIDGAEQLCAVLDRARDNMQR